MIKYTLKCSGKHSFDSWFHSAEAFDTLQTKGQVSCPLCGDNHVVKAIMAPQVHTARDCPNAGERPVAMHALTAPASPAEAAILELKKKIQESSEYVGSDFAEEARAIHEGEAPERSIYGETDSEQARQLVEDGIPVAPLPFTPTRKTN